MAPSNNNRKKKYPIIHNSPLFRVFGVQNNNTYSRTTEEVIHYQEKYYVIQMKVISGPAQLYDIIFGICET